MLSVTACFKANLPAGTSSDTIPPDTTQTTEPARTPDIRDLAMPAPTVPPVQAKTPAHALPVQTKTPLPASTFADSVPEEEPRLIWQRIAKNAAFSQLYNHPRVNRHKQDYLERERLLSIVTRRAEPFIHFIVTEVEQRNMPAELAILPMVESGYSPRALSRTKAAGLWQFISRTAGEYGLKRTCCYDARYDVYASTMAALEYLGELHAEFDGNWVLALMAYNAGPNRVKAALQSNAKTSPTENYWNLQLPYETLEYVPRLLALSAIVRDPELSATLLHPIANEPHVEILEINKRILPAKLVKSASIDRTELQALNPALQHLDYPLPAGHRLLVPKHKAEPIASIIARLPEEPHHRYRHTIVYGESLSVIAARYGTSVSALREANRLNGTAIQAGKTLVIPSTARHPEQTRDQYRHTIVYGESLSVIAARYGTSVSALRKVNRLNGTTIQAGKTLVIPFR